MKNYILSVTTGLLLSSLIPTFTVAAGVRPMQAHPPEANAKRIRCDIGFVEAFYCKTIEGPRIAVCQSKATSSEFYWQIGEVRHFENKRNVGSDFTYISTEAEYLVSSRRVRPASILAATDKISITWIDKVSAEESWRSPESPADSIIDDFINGTTYSCTAKTMRQNLNILTKFK